MGLALVYTCLLGWPKVNEKMFVEKPKECGKKGNLLKMSVVSRLVNV